MTRTILNTNKPRIMYQVVCVVIAIAFSVVILGSCDRIKNKGRSIAGTAKGVVRRQLDKLIPPYDSGTPDTKINQKWFKDFLKIDVSKDVKGILVWSDNVGIDNTVLITFECADSTAKKIIKRNELKLCEPDDRLYVTEDGISWWDNLAMSKIIPFKAGVDGKYWSYFWYDSTSGKAYFEDFDL